MRYVFLQADSVSSVANLLPNPALVDQYCALPPYSDALDEYIRCYSAPGGLHSMLEIYRATLHDAQLNREAAQRKLPMPVLAVGGAAFIGDDNERQMREVAEDVRGVVLPWGHQLAEEAPRELADTYLEFFGTA